MVEIEKELFCILVDIVKGFNRIFENRCKTKNVTDDELFKMRRKLHFERLSCILAEAVEINWEDLQEKKQLEIIKFILELNNDKGKFWIEKIKNRKNELKLIKEQWDMDNNSKGKDEYNYLNPEGFQLMEFDLNVKKTKNVDLDLFKNNYLNNELNTIENAKIILTKALNNWKSKNNFIDKYKITGTYEFGFKSIEDVEINIIFLNYEESNLEKYFGSDLTICTPLLSQNCKGNSLYCFLCKESLEELKITTDDLNKYANNDYKSIVIKIEGIKCIIEAKSSFYKYETLQTLLEKNLIKNSKAFTTAFIILNLWAKSCKIDF
uniref:Uncharacterized protein n=1 Tax=Meloidogyne hapla TaxID=6305 RepID=A0A1I8BHX4_MELHA